jgi:hypothetical protein
MVKRSWLAAEDRNAKSRYSTILVPYSCNWSEALNEARKLKPWCPFLECSIESCKENQETQGSD